MMSLLAHLAAAPAIGALAYAFFRGDSPKQAELGAKGSRGRRDPLGAKSGFARAGFGLEFRGMPSAVELGAMAGMPVRLLPRDSVIVFGPTQSHKTSGLVLPALRSFQGAVVATSVKDDLVSAAREGRDSQSLLVFDPFGVGKDGNCHWNPLLRGLDDEEARHLSAVICHPSARGNEETEFWVALASKLLYPLLLAAARLEVDLAAVRNWVDSRDFREPSGALVGHNCGDAIAALASSLDRDERQLSSVLTTLERLLEPFVFGTTSGSGTNARLFRADPGKVLCLLAPPNRQDEAGALFAAVLRLLLDDAFASPPRSGLLLALDEAANCAPMPNLDEVISVIAAYGIQSMTIFQDYAQVRARYGERAATLVNNHRAKLFLSGLSDPETLALAEALCGSKVGDVGTEAVLSRGSLRSLAPGKGLLVYGHRRPAIVRLRSARAYSTRFRIRRRLPIHTA